VDGKIVDGNVFEDRLFILQSSVPRFSEWSRDGSSTNRMYRFYLYLQILLIKRRPVL
jgi:hypothetical protein